MANMESATGKLDTKIGFDSKRAACNRTGLGNYSRFVLDGLSHILPVGSIHLCVPSPQKTIAEYKTFLAANPCIKEIYPKSFFWKKLSSLWRSFGIVSSLKKNGISLYHGLSNELPFGLKKQGIKSIVTIHDLVFLRYPNFYPRLDRLIYRYKSRYACISADHIIAVSECTKKDIVEFFNISPEKIDVIYQGCESRFSSDPTAEQIEQAKANYKIPDRYILFVGSLEKRKNLLVLVKALDYMPRDLHLVAIGRHAPYAQKTANYAAEHGLSDRLHLFSNVSNQDLHVFYKKALIFAYPSFYEGFGIPLIEAIFAGLPIIAATGSCLEEAAGPDSIYISPQDEKIWGETITKIISDPSTMQKMVEHSKLYVKQFDKHTSALEIANLYKKILDV